MFMKYIMKTKYTINKKLKIFLLIIGIILIIYIIYNAYNIRKETFNEIVLIEDSIYGKFKCFNGDKVICESIQKTKSWEPHILNILKENYKVNTNFLDIGSNYGCHTIGIANKIREENGNGKIYSFELQPEIIKLFKENLKINNLEKYVIINEFGLGDKNEEKQFSLSKDYDTNENPGRMSLYNDDSSDKLKKETVSIKKLDDLNIENISLIKIDVEGYELEAFAGGINTISKYKPIIVIEIWKNNLDKYMKWINNTFPFYEIKPISEDDYILIPNIK